MRRVRVMGIAMLFLLGGSPFSQAQSVAANTVMATNANAIVPPLVNFSGTLIDANGKPLTGNVTVTFSLYSEQRGGAAIWMESQTVQADSAGSYTAMLGASSSQGLPPGLFFSGQVRWLGVQPQGEAYEQPRVMLVAVPYALKAQDAQTIGGLPPSAFVLATPASGTASASAPANTSSPSPLPPNGAITGSGMVDFVPLWDATSDIISSVLFQSGSGSSAKIGINTATPTATLSVKGTTALAGATTVQGTLTLPAAGTATPSGGKDSQPITQAASAFNSSTSTAVNQTFEWQAEPANNDTSSASGTLNLLSGQGTAKPSETGFHIASDGQVTFAEGQTFPGTGDGTITGVTAGTDLTGGGTTGSVTLNLDTTKVPQLNAANTFIGNQTVNGTLTATSLSGSGAGLSNVTASNSNALGGLASSAFAQLAANNTFSGTQIINGSNLTGALQVTGSGLEAILSTDTAFSGTAVYGSATSATGNAVGVTGVSSGASGYGVTGTSPFVGVYGASSGNSAYGVEGTGSNVGVYGATTGTGASNFGVEGTGSNVGVYGAADGASIIGAGLGTAGVWGDTGAGNTGPGDGYAAVQGTANDTMAGYFLNNSNLSPALWAENDTSASGAEVFLTDSISNGAYCLIDIDGDLACSGSINGVVNADGGARKVSLYATQSPENWFEDAGSGLLSGGSASIALDPTFAQTVNTSADYHVFLTPKGDSEGLYVSNETPQGFEVHELRGGHSSIAFDYRIMAKRMGYENVRLTDVTEQYQRLQQQHQLRRERRQKRRAARAAAGPIAAVAIPVRK